MIWKSMFAIVLATQVSLAQEKLMDVSEEGTSTSTDSVQARQDAIQDVVERVSGRLIREIIGDAKFDRNLSSIKTKIYAQSDKYISFIKTGAAKQVGSDTKTPIQLRVSLTSLESLLKQSGFLSAQEGPAVLLPMVSYYDLINSKSMKWWYDDELNPFLKSLDRHMVEALKKNFSSLGFQSLDPQTWQFKKQVPPLLQLDSPRIQDYVALAENMKAQLALKGDVKIDQGKTSQSYKITSKLMVVGSNGRVIADSVRSVETDSGFFSSVVPKKMIELFEDVSQDLAGQVQEVYSRGTLGANLIRLVFRGNYDFKEVETLKSDVKSQIKSIKTLTERLFSRGSVEFDVDVTGGAEQLAQSFERARIRGSQVKIESVGSDRLEISLKR